MVFGSLHVMEIIPYGSAILFVAILGAMAAKDGGSKIGKTAVRTTFLGTIAMTMKALIGHPFETAIL